MSTDLLDVEEARLQFTHISGEIAGLDTSVKYLMEKAADFFMQHEDVSAKLLRTIAGSLAQDIEVKGVEQVECLKTLEELEAKDADNERNT